MKYIMTLIGALLLVPVALSSELLGETVPYKGHVLDGPGMVYVMTPAAEKEILERVKEIYASLETQIRGYEENAVETDGEAAGENRNEKYCTPNWVDLFNKVCAKEQRTDELCLDVDYWVMGQDVGDFSADGFKVESVTGDNLDHATVWLNLHNFGEETPVRLELVKEHGQWLIDNFINLKYGLDFRKIMNKYLEGE